MARKQRRYPPEFRQEIVALVRSGRSPEALAREFEPSASAIRRRLYNLRMSRFRGQFIGAVYVALRFNTPSVGGEQDFPPTTVNGHRGCQGFGH